MPVKYGEYIRSVAWKRVRGEFLKRVGWKCERCYTRRAAVVHHLNYSSLGYEQPQDRMALCDVCHEALHRPPIPANDNNAQLELPFQKAK